MKINRPLVTIISFLGFILLFLYSCDTTSSTKFEPVTFSGLVTDAADVPLPNAIVRITSPLPQRFTVTDQEGRYSFTVDVDSTVTFRIEAQKEGFTTATQEFLAIPERDVSLPVFKLRRIGEDGDSPVQPPPPPPPDDDSNTNSAFITMQSLEHNTIQVRETGGIEQTKFEFVVTDSTGNPIGNNRAVFVRFEVLSGPGGGEGVFPDSIRTENGIARGTLSSGTVSGVVQIRASFTRNGIVARSNPVSITIAGGLPDDNHFEVHADPMNVPAADRVAVPISVLLGDRYGNTVPAGTAVFFSTDRGNIDGSVTTDENGIATAVLRTNSTSRALATVRVETANDQGEKLSRTVQVRYSGKPEMTVTPAGVDLATLTTQTFQVNISDEDGNPLAFGTNYEVTVDNDDLQLLGTIQAPIPDAINPGPKITDFEVSLRKPSGAQITEMVTLRFSADGPNGSVYIEFYLDPPPPPQEPAPPAPPFTEPSSMYLLEASLKEIGVQATGQREDTQLTFQVVDVNGKPLGTHNPVDVSFRFGARPNGGESITAGPLTTNDEGQVTATLVSGTRSGVVQVIAETQTSTGAIIRSQPTQVVIHAGLPSQQHFSLLTESRNAAFGIGAVTNWTVMVGDRYGNVVPDGTAVYFTTTGGFIQGAAFTENGRATAQLQVGNPFPAGGFATITATTANDDNQIISTSGQMIFSGSPIITVDPTTFNIPNAEDQRFTYTVMDSQGNPMVEGTTIKVTVEGDEISVLGDVDIVVGRLNAGFANIPQLTQYSFIIDDAKPDETNDTPVQITIEVDGPNGTARYTLNGRKAKIPVNGVND